MAASARSGPIVADEVETLHLKIQLATIEAQREQAIAAAKRADVELLQFRHIVVTTMPDVIQQKVLGCKEVKVVEYRDRVIKDEDVIRDGETITKLTIAPSIWCDRFFMGFLLPQKTEADPTPLPTGCYLP